MVDWSLILYGTKEDPETYEPPPEGNALDVGEGVYGKSSSASSSDGVRRPLGSFGDATLHTLSTKVFYDGGASLVPGNDIQLDTNAGGSHQRGRVDGKQPPSRSEGNAAFWSYAARIFRWRF